MKGASFAFVACALVATSARAQSTDADRAEPTKTTVSEAQRPWLYVDDPTIAAPLHVVGALTTTYSGNDRSVSRAFASTDDGPGAKEGVTVQLGLVRMLALDATGVVGGYGSVVAAGFMTGLRFAPFDGAKHGFRLAIAAGYMLDLDRSSGAYARVSASYDVGRLRVAAMIHGEHVARPGGDPLDVFATAGVSVRLAPAFRLGAEYIVQDSEETWADDAESGVHQFVGVVASFVLLHDRLFINAGPALAFRTEIGQVQPVGRAVVSYAF